MTLINPTFSKLNHGYNYSNEKSEKDKITKHLSLVLEHLTLQNTTHLQETQLLHRKKCLNLLKDYITQQTFPSLFQCPLDIHRTPCFIDDLGNICAVGYLIEKTRNRSLVEMINKCHKFDTIEEISKSNDILLNWSIEMGFRLIELSMIQPTYNWNSHREIYEYSVIVIDLKLAVLLDYDTSYCFLSNPDEKISFLKNPYTYVKADELTDEELKNGSISSESRLEQLRLDQFDLSSDIENERAKIYHIETKLKTLGIKVPERNTYLQPKIPEPEPHPKIPSPEPKKIINNTKDTKGYSLGVRKQFLYFFVLSILGIVLYYVFTK